MAEFEVKIVVVGSARSGKGLWPHQRLLLQRRGLHVGCKRSCAPAAAGKSSLVQRLVTGRFVKHLSTTYAPAFEAKKVRASCLRHLKLAERPVAAQSQHVPTPRSLRSSRWM